jgi:hypothetical protein
MLLKRFDVIVFFPTKVFTVTFIVKLLKLPTKNENYHYVFLMFILFYYSFYSCVNYCGFMISLLCKYDKYGFYLNKLPEILQ